MPYLNIDLDYFNHPKTLLLEGALGGHRATLIPIKLWAHVGKYHSEDGILKGYTAQTIAKAVEFDSRHAEQLIEHLVNCGFISQQKGGFKVNNWLEHNGHLAMFRERGRIAAQARWGKKKGLENTPAPKQKPANATTPPATNKTPLFTDEQIHELRAILAKKCNHRMISEANEKAWAEILGKVQKANRKKKIDNLYAYTVTACMTYGD